MSNGLGGLASGLMAGARLGMDIREQQARRTREEEESLLRGKQEERAESGEVRSQESHSATLTQLKNQEERAKSGEVRSQEAHDVSLKQAESQEERLKAGEVRAEEASDIAKARLNLDIKRENWDKQKQLKSEKQNNIKAMAPVEFNRVLGGGAFSDEFMEMAEGTQYDPKFMATPEYKDAAKIAYETTDKVLQKFKTDPKSVEVRDYNGRDFIDSMNVLLGPDIRQGVGEADPNTGKVIDNKRIVSILPAPGGKGFVFDVETTLSDGAKYTAPITENRTTDPDDPVKIVPFDQMVENISGQMQMASAFNQSDLKSYMTANFPVGKDVSASSQETTRRQWLREQGDVDKWESDQINDIDPLVVDDYDATVEKIKTQAQTRRDRIDGRYGKVTPIIGAEGSGIPAPSGGGEVRIDVNTWAKDDAGKRKFMEDAQTQAESRGVENPFSSYSAQELDLIYREYANDKSAEGVASSMR